MLKILKKMFDSNEKAISKVRPVVDEIVKKTDEMQKLTLEQMQKKVDDMRQQLKPILEKIPAENKTSLIGRSDKPLDKFEIDLKNQLQSFVPDLFAMLREINRRKFAKPHYEVQLLAAVILAQGHSLTELKTGEGKTQVFHLPAALYGITGRGSHVITVNDYLARRDAEHAGHAMADLGISVGVITPQAAYKFVPDDQLLAVKGEEAAKEREQIDISKLSDMRGVNLVECSKQEAYSQNVVYGTNNEFGFDYLRDNMVVELKNRVQKELYFCLIDEADSILIDEARTPLIISSAAQKSNELYDKFAKIAKKLNAESHYTVDEKSHSVNLTEEGVDFVEKLLGVTNLWENYELAHHLDNALKAETLYKNDDEYIIKNGEVLIVDEFTGRVLPGRRYSDGLHQAIEAKEGVEVNRESQTMATITFQNFFKLYKVIGGGSGTILTEAEEFNKIYQLDSYEVPTNKTVIRIDKTDKIYKNKMVKFNAVVDEITKIHASGQPILVGTTSVEASEYLSRQLDKVGIEHEVLNAKFHEREAAIVSKAGEKGSVTVATNMAGRGTDIPLGKGVMELGGLSIIGTERHEARRIDNQLRGRSGRQGEPGQTQFFVALDDEIMRIQGGDIVQKLMQMTNFPDDYPIENRLISRNIEMAQKRMEGHHFDIRKRLVDYDNVMNQQREIFYTRRYKLLELIEQTNQAVSQEQKDKVKIEIGEMIEQILIKEIEDIVSKHFFAERDDRDDQKQLITDFMSLLDAEDLATVLNQQSQNFTTVEKYLTQALTKLNADQIIEKLIELIKQVSKLKIEQFGENLAQIYKIIAVQAMDGSWTEHLNVMSDLRDGINLRGYAQRDPLVEYKNESFKLFENFINGIDSQIARRILKIRRVENNALPNNNLATNEDQVSDVLTGSREMLPKMAIGGNNLNPTKRPVVKSANVIAKVGRNDPCPCGSGLKYKRCGMINALEHKA